MKPKMIWANLAVDDLKRTTQFYTGLGFKLNSAHASKKLTSFYLGEDDFVIHFFLKEALEGDAKNETANFQNVNEVLFTLSAQNKNQVDDWAQEVAKAGGTIISKPQEFGQGYYGFLFADPDGHRYNVFFMEGL